MANPSRRRLCDRQLTNHGQLLAHFHINHPGDKLFKCSRCNSSHASQLNTMNRHFHKLCCALPTGATVTAATTTTSTNTTNTTNSSPIDTVAAAGAIAGVGEN